MPFKNYTTTIDEHKTIGEIMGMLAKNKARQILTDYNENGEVKSISFMYPYQDRLIGIKLPGNVNAVYKIMMQQREKKEIKIKVDMEQATRTAWRNIKDWLEAQMALVEADQAKMEQIFLPYTLNSNGQTFFEAYEHRLLTGGENHESDIE